MNRFRPMSFLACAALLVLPAAAVELEHQASRDLVDFVTRAAGLVEKSGARACEAFKQEGGEWLEGERYVFVLDMQGNAICHPNPSLEGRNLTEVRDPDGKPIMKLILRQLSRGAGDGWVHYLWPRPGETVLGWKSTYVREAVAPDGTAMVVASGAYGLEVEKAFVVDRVAEAAELLESEGRKALEVLRDKAGGFLFFDTYVFVMGMDGVQLVNPAFPDLEGKSSLEIVDDDGVRPARAMIDLLSTEEEGWVSYRWPRPGDERPTRKEAFVRKVSVDGQAMVVGAGVYRD